MIESPDHTFAELIWLDNYVLKRKKIDVTELERRLQAKVVDIDKSYSNAERVDSFSGTNRFNSFSEELSEEEIISTLVDSQPESSNKEKWSKFFFEE
jgi:hypothetical protein